MKIRTGFVSNSSSSSFVVTAKSTMEVFKKMISLVKQDYDDYEDGKTAWDRYHGRDVDRFIKAHDDGFNEGIIIPFTCNFETFIFPVKDGKAYIESCNNHPWEEVFPEMVEDESDCRHSRDDKTMFVNVKTNKTCTAKGFTKKLYASYGMTLYED
jgi:hypothetical protein